MSFGEALCIGERCCETAMVTPRTRDLVECPVVQTRYERCKGNMMQNEEWTR